VRVTTAVTPKPRSHCDIMEDPFAGVPFPASAGCDYMNVVVEPKQTATLKPGTYCGGLALKGKATLEPGVYVIKNGPFVTTSQAVVTGTDVTFGLTGSNAGFTIDAGGDVTLKAATSGTYGGILFMQEKASNPGFENRLAGGSGTKLTGAVYTPTQKVTSTGGSGVANATPFMPIVADQIRISGSTATQVDLTGIDLAAPLPSSESGVRLVY
jgi:hypothetical protein